MSKPKLTFRTLRNQALQQGFMEKTPIFNLFMVKSGLNSFPTTQLQRGSWLTGYEWNNTSPPAC